MQQIHRQHEPRKLRRSGTQCAPYQFFGQVDVDPHSKVMTVMLKDLNGVKLFATHLDPQPSKNRSSEA